MVSNYEFENSKYKLLGLRMIRALLLLWLFLRGK